MNWFSQLIWMILFNKKFCDRLLGWWNIEGCGLFTYLFKDAVRDLDCKVLNDRMWNEEWIGKDVERRIMG
jgi:hypothetical protein